MRRGVVIVALVGGFVAATTLPAAAQYWDNAVGLNIGFGPPVYGAYAAAYAAPPAAYAYSAPTTSQRTRSSKR